VVVVTYINNNDGDNLLSVTNTKKDF